MPVPKIVIRNNLMIILKALTLAIFLTLIESLSHTWLIKIVLFASSYCFVDGYIDTHYFPLLFLHHTVDVIFKLQRIIQRGHTFIMNPKCPAPSQMRVRRRQRPRQSGPDTRPSQPRGPRQRAGPPPRSPLAQRPSPAPVPRPPVQDTRDNRSNSGHDNLENIVKHRTGRKYHFCDCAGCVYFDEIECATRKCAYCTVSYNID